MRPYLDMRILGMGHRLAILDMYTKQKGITFFFSEFYGKPGHV